ncbi:hypothetical protein RAA17_20250 [Komagataeibacter rhaeticus]|nr:hypothetical protein [Komagataeibacter rhaeticus]
MPPVPRGLRGDRWPRPVLHGGGVGLLALCSGRRVGVRPAADLVALMVMAAVRLHPGPVAWLLPGLCWLGTRGCWAFPFPPCRVARGAAVPHGGYRGHDRGPGPSGAGCRRRAWWRTCAGAGC